MIRRAFGSWGIGGKLAVSLVLLLLVQQTWEIASDSRFSSRIIEIHGRTKLAEGEATLRAFYSASREEAKQRLLALTREPRFKAVLRLGDGPTLAARLRELLAEQSAVAAAFTRPDGTLLASAVNDPRLVIDDLLRRHASTISQADPADPAATWLALSGLPLMSASVPVDVSGDNIGVLTVASAITEQTLGSLSDTTGAKIALHDGRGILLHSPGLVVTEEQLSPRVTRAERRRPVGTGRAAAQ